MAWDPNSPQGTELGSTLDDRIRELKLDLQSALQAEHDFPVDVGSPKALHKEGTARISSGLDANKPATMKSGQLYYATDTGYLYRGTGTGIERLLLDVDKVDGAHAGTAANNVLKLDANGKVTARLTYEGAANGVATLDANGKVPLTSIPTPLTGKDADTVDGAHAGTAANNVLKLDASGLVPLGNIPATLTGKDADTVDGAHAGTSANNVLKLDSNGLVPLGNIPSGVNADKLDGKHWVTVVAGSVTVNHGTSMNVNLLYGGTHRYYLVSVMENGSGDISWRIVRPSSSSAYDRLVITNGSVTSDITVSYSVLAWE